MEEHGDEMEDYPILVATYDYKSKNERELDIKKGDELVWYKEEGAGWYRGQNERTKFSGWFPQNYAEKTERSVRLPKIDKTVEEEVSLDDEESFEEERKLKVDQTKVHNTIRQKQQELAKRGHAENIFDHQE